MSCNNSSTEPLQEEGWTSTERASTCASRSWASEWSSCMRAPMECASQSRAVKAPGGLILPRAWSGAITHLLSFPRQKSSSTCATFVIASSRSLYSDSEGVCKPHTPRSEWVKSCLPCTRVGSLSNHSRCSLSMQSWEISLIICEAVKRSNFCRSPTTREIKVHMMSSS